MDSAKTGIDFSTSIDQPAHPSMMADQLQVLIMITPEGQFQSYIVDYSYLCNQRLRYT